MASVKFCGVEDEKSAGKDEGRASQAFGDGGWDGMKGRKMDVRRGIVTEESWSWSGLAWLGFWLLQAQSTGYLVLAVLSTSTGDLGGEERQPAFVSGPVTARTLGPS